jgi:hypothetical protein
VNEYGKELHCIWNVEWHGFATTGAVDSVNSLTIFGMTLKPPFVELNL